MLKSALKSNSVPAPMHVRRATAVVDVHIVLERDQKVLLGKRRNTGYADELFHLPAGHLEENESVIQAAVREAREELGVQVEPSDLELIFVLHQRSNVGRIGFFFRAKRWTGRITNREPEKCAALKWFSLDALPFRMVTYAREVLDRYRSGQFFSTKGW